MKMDTAVSSPPSTQPPIHEAIGVECSGLGKTYRAQGKNIVAVEGFEMKLRPGSFGSLIGPSGCGKSTVLRMICGLEDPTAGEILIDGRTPQDVRTSYGIGVAFQEAALLPWRSVRTNIRFPSELHGTKISPDEVDGLIELVGLRGFEEVRPGQLSGGMRQRVSIARALSVSPTVLLLDEPFGALDEFTRQNLVLELQRVWEARAVSTVMVTHSITEAVFLSDQIFVMTTRPGKVQRIVDVPLERPRTPEMMFLPEFHSVVDEVTSLLFSVHGAYRRGGIHPDDRDAPLRSRTAPSF